MKRYSRSRKFGRTLQSILSAGLLCAALPVAIVPRAAADGNVAPASQAGTSWLEALKDTSRTGRTTVIVVTSSSLETSLKWADHVRSQLNARYGNALNVSELRAESDPQRVRSLNVRSIPTLLVYRNDGKGGLTLAGYREGTFSEEELFGLVQNDSATTTQQWTDQAVSSNLRRGVRVQRASVSTAATNPQVQAAGQPSQAEQAGAPVSMQDAQVAAATHQYAQTSAQSSPQAYMGEPPTKQMPPAPVKTPPQQPVPPPTTYQAPPQQPTQPVYAAPPAQTAQPVYAYVPQQPMYAAPPSAAPVMVQPPAGQVVVQPAPLNVTVAPSPPPQVTYMAPAMAPAPMMAAAPMTAPAPMMAPAPNAFAAPPVQPAMAPPTGPEPAMGVPQPGYGAPQPAFAAGPGMGFGAGPGMGFGPGAGMGFGPSPAAGIGSMAMGMMLTNPNILDRILGGFGRLLSERSYPRIRMNPESPSLFSAPAGMGGFVGINPAMAMAPSAANPVQAYMAVPNGGGGGGDATEAYLKAYIALCKEKGITPNLPGWEPPAPPPPTGPVPSPQDVHQKKKWWFR